MVFALQCHQHKTRKRDSDKSERCDATGDDMKCKRRAHKNKKSRNKNQETKTKIQKTRTKETKTKTQEQ
jgi:hypothetical protein